MSSRFPDLPTEHPDQGTSGMQLGLSAIYNSPKASLTQLLGPQLNCPLPTVSNSDLQSLLPTLSAIEKWDLEGYFQLMYALAQISAPPWDLMLWEKYSPFLIDAFFKAADDEGQLFTDKELIAAFKGCSKAFAKHYGWPENEFFVRHTSGKDALRGILQLIKLARGFNIGDEEWWELRRNMWTAFARPFGVYGWISPESDIFHRLFHQSIKIFVGLGVKQGTWTYALLDKMMQWRQLKESQEEVALGRITLAHEKQSAVEGAWQTLRRSINGEMPNTPKHGSAIQHQESANGNGMIFPALPLFGSELNRPLTPDRVPTSTTPLRTSGLPLTPGPTPLKTFTDSISSTPPRPGNIFAGWQTCVPANPTDPNQFFMAPPTLRNHTSLLGEELEPGFGDLLDLEFDDSMDLDLKDWNVEGSAFEDEGFESQPQEACRNQEDISKDAMQWCGKQLWEMSDDEFQQFCSFPSRGGDE